jgi:hypothetical protein
MSSTEVSGHPNWCDFSHSQITGKNLFDCVRTCCKPFREDRCRNDWLFAEKLRYHLSNVRAGSASLEFVTNGKVAVFEAPVLTLDRGETNNSFYKDSIQFSIYRFGSFPLQEAKFHHASFLVILLFDPLNLRFDFLMGRSVGNPTVAIEQRIAIQI